MDKIPCCLPKLVSLKMVGCQRCQHLPPFSRLPRLKYLQLWDLNALEYIEIGRDINFPSLECLELYGLCELKGWSIVEDDSDRTHESDQHVLQPYFPRLSVLKISGCPKLLSIPLVPKLETLDAQEFHGKLLKHLLYGGGSPTSTPSRLKELHIVSAQELDSLSIDQFSLESFTINRYQELINLTVESPSSLQRLEIKSCSRLRVISSVLLNLSVLRELVIDDCQELNWGDNTSVPSGAWQGLNSLLSLTMRDMAKLESLPRHLGCLTMLQELCISWLYNLRTLPEWIGQLRELQRLDIRHCHKLSALPESLQNLKDLQHLHIVECPKLERRYRQQGGKDWPFIQHIPKVIFGRSE